MILLFALVAACSKRPIERAMERAEVPGISVAVVRDGALARTELAGVADAETRAPVTERTPFEIASIGKPIIAIAVMQLVERRQMSLEDDVGDLVPLRVRNPAHPSDPITLRMLLQHTSSVHDRVPELRAATTGQSETPSLEPFLRAYLDERAYTDAAPGTKVEYSNVGFTLAALAVERAAKEPFAAYVRDHILIPAGVSEASYRSSGATPHKGRAPLPPVFHAVYPVVDLRASASDVARVVVALMKGALLGADAAREMLDERLGWQSITLGDRALLGHEGEDDGASTLLVVDLGKRDAAVVLTNGDAFASNDPSRARALEDLTLTLLR